MVENSLKFILNLKTHANKGSTFFIKVLSLIANAWGIEAASFCGAQAEQKIERKARPEVVRHEATGGARQN